MSEFKTEEQIEQELIETAIQAIVDKLGGVGTSLEAINNKLVQQTEITKESNIKCQNIIDQLKSSVDEWDKTVKSLNNTQSENKVEKVDENSNV